MACPIIKEQLLVELYRGPITVPCDSALRDAIDFTEYSKNAVSRAMGSLIKNGKAIRSRREPEHMDDSDRPVTYSRVPQL